MDDEPQQPLPPQSDDETISFPLFAKNLKLPIPFFQVVDCIKFTGSSGSANGVNYSPVEWNTEKEGWCFHSTSNRYYQIEDAGKYDDEFDKERYVLIAVPRPVSRETDGGHILGVFYKSDSGGWKFTPESWNYFNVEETDKRDSFRPDRNTYDLVKLSFECTFFKCLRPPCFVRLLTYDDEPRRYGRMHRTYTYDQLIQYYGNIVFFEKSEGEVWIQKPFVERWLKDPFMRTFDKIVHKRDVMGRQFYNMT